MADVPRIMELIEEARAIMRSCGNVNQWIGGYPNRETIENDINNGHCYLCVEQGKAAVFLAPLVENGKFLRRF